MQVLTPIQVRVLGALMEKKETTPDQYPLTVKALVSACNQKTMREPVTAYTEGDVGHTLRELAGLDLAREAWGSRVPRWEHTAAKVLGVHSPGLALLCSLMLRGPQTPGELKTNTQRLYAFEDLDDVRLALERLARHEPPLVTGLPRAPGQKEGRFAHLLSGAPSMDHAPAPVPEGGLEARLQALEDEIAALSARVSRLEEGD